MTPANLHGFFGTSAAVAGALIGLLFVAISVAEERLAAEDAAQAHRVRAASALTAFLNTLTVSLFALLPGEKLGWAALFVAAVGLLFVAASLLPLLRVRRSQPDELGEAAFPRRPRSHLWAPACLRPAVGPSPARREPRPDDRHFGIVCFLIGIARSWEVIGGPSIALRHEVSAILQRRGPEGSDRPTDSP